MFNRNFFFFLILLISPIIFIHCKKGEPDYTTLLIHPIIYENQRSAPFAQVLLFNKKDSLLQDAKQLIENTDFLETAPNYYQLDSLGQLVIIDSQGIIFEKNKTYYFYIYLKKSNGKIYENFDDELLENSDPTNYSTHRPITPNTIVKAFPYLYSR